MFRYLVKTEEKFMRLRTISVILAFFMSISVSQFVLASSLTAEQEQCYAVAMVGYDSVINSNLNVPLDQVIMSMVTHNDDAQVADIYRDYLLFVVMDAYNWKGSAHTYAVKTLFNCASHRSEVTSQ